MNIRLLNRFLDDTAFMLGSHGDVLLFDLLGKGPSAAESEYLKSVREELKPKMTIENGIAHIPIEGLLGYNPDAMELKYYGMEDSRHIYQMVMDARLNKDVKGVQLNIDSPGGFFTGGPEISDAVAALNKVKPVEAYIGGTGASLAYMIASQAGHITAGRSARVGSIGAYSVMTDLSVLAHNVGVKVQVFKNREATYKAMGAPGTALQDVHKEHIQEGIQACFDEFKALVTSARPLISSEAMRGQVFTGKEAMKRGLVDAVGDKGQATMHLKARMG